MPVDTRNGGGGRGVLLIWGFYRLAFLNGDRKGVGWGLGEIILMYLRRLKEDPEEWKGWGLHTYLYRGQVTEELIVKKYVNTTSCLGRYQKLCIQYISGKFTELYKKIIWCLNLSHRPLPHVTSPTLLCFYSIIHQPKRIFGLLLNRCFKNFFFFICNLEK